MQSTMFETSVKVQRETAEWGTFRDSLKAPVHGWFTYPAGFSYKAVEHSIKKSGLQEGFATIYDPFMGSGTTNIVAKSLGYHSLGVEAHPFVHRITMTKFYWELTLDEINESVEYLHKILVATDRPQQMLELLNNEFPELILKCFLPETLFELLVLRNGIAQIALRNEVKEFLRTALICTLRDVSIAATGWPYIAPNKIKITSMSKKGWETYKNRVYKMYGDIMEIRRNASPLHTNHGLFYGDSRDTTTQIDDNSADHIFTSPPYLNNFDYADRTRLEMYFTGEAKNWGEISDMIRTKLMTSATTQINRQDSKYEFLSDFQAECPEQYRFLRKATLDLAEVRLTKGGKKSYDLMVIGYFNDMYKILKDNFRVLKPDSKALYILGDSAPYGVHIPTDELIGQIGVAIGFKRYSIQLLRERGGKWENNPQRHNIPLRESIVLLEK